VSRQVAAPAGDKLIRSFWRVTDAKAGDTVTLKVIRQRVAADHTA
jgi:hypothetical protein